MGQADAFFGFEKRRWYPAGIEPEGDRVKRVNLLEYFELAEVLVNAKRATSLDQSTAGHVYMSTMRLVPKLRAFAKDDNGFSTCKHVATALADTIENWSAANLENDGKLAFDKWDVELQSWQYSGIGSQIDSFRHVFEAESRDVDVYSVGEVSIYKTSALVSKGAEILPFEIRGKVSKEVLSEFDNAGRCLAFSLPTACGFHALRGMELVMDAYLRSFDVDTSGFKSWNDYIQAAKKLTDEKKGKGQRKPAAKVATMLDRMRELDRNPLMHPRNVLDEVSADMLYKLAAITIVEMVRDMPEAQTAAKVEGQLSPIAELYAPSGNMLLSDLPLVPDEEAKPTEAA